MDRRPPERAKPRIAPIAVVLTTGAVVLGLSAALARALHGGRDLPSKPAAEPTAREDTVAKAGRLTYQVHCARCHGPEGHGDGPDAERLQPPPRDFASGRWKTAPTANAIRKVVVEGLPGSAMPGWGQSLSRRELDGLAAHVLVLASIRSLDDRPMTAGLAGLLDQAGFVPDASHAPAPPLDLRDPVGNRLTLDQTRGRLVLVKFWGTSCASCIAEMPAMEQFAARYRDQGFVLLPVCIDEPDAETVRDVAGGRRVFLDPSGTARLRFDVQSLPTYVLIDRSGRVLGTAQGARDWTGKPLDDLVRACLESPGEG